ncbi:phosphatase PAP2 family protein [Streptomyces sp. NPDC001941]|uniref:phosphatase PAP2 family protein n=1 Tax=Streptomyces sp. NPDC001941 TaxID=3154659 RepID=UPI00332F6D2F
MRETPRSQGTAGGAGTEPPQPRPGRALAHTTGASGPGTPHRSDSRPPHTPRGARCTGPGGRPGTTPPVPGRPALLPGLLCGLLAALFALFTWQVAAHGPLRRLDERLDASVVGRGPQGLAEFLSDLGSLAVGIPVLLAAAAYAWWRGRRRATAAVLLANALTPALVSLVKVLVARPGPLTAETGYFPSGHAATAMVAYAGAAWLLSGRLLPVAAVVSAATGVGLVLRGYHWPLDVLGSWCLCGVLLTVAFTVGGRGRPAPLTSGRRRSSG